MQISSLRVTRLFVSLALALGLVACGGHTTCRGTCDDTHVTCRQRCTDDACRTACDADLDRCSGTCTTMSLSSPGDGGHS